MQDNLGFVRTCFLRGCSLPESCGPCRNQGAGLPCVRVRLENDAMPFLLAASDVGHAALDRPQA